MILWWSTCQSLAQKKQGQSCSPRPKADIPCKGKSLDGRKHGNLGAHILLNNDLVSLPLINLAQVKGWAVAISPAPSQPSLNAILSSSWNPSPSLFAATEDLHLQAWMMFEVSGTQRKISPVRYEIVFKSPSPGLSSPTTARETRLGQLVGAYRRHNIPA